MNCKFRDSLIFVDPLKHRDVALHWLPRPLEPFPKSLIRGIFQRVQLANVLIVTESVDENLYLSARNLKNVDVRDVSGIDPVSLIRHEKVLVTVGALKKMEEALA